MFFSDIGYRQWTETVEKIKSSANCKKTRNQINPNNTMKLLNCPSATNKVF